MKKIWKIFSAEWSLETRSKNTFFSAVLFTLLALFIFSFSLNATSNLSHPLINGILWIVTIFVGNLVILQHSQRLSINQFQSIFLLAGYSPTLIFLSYIGSLLFMLTLLEILLFFLMALFFNFSFGNSLLPVFIVVFLGNLGFCSVSALISTMLSTHKFKDILLPVLTFPLSIPLFIVSTKTTLDIFLNVSLKGIGFLLGFDLILIATSVILSQYAMEGSSS